MLANGTFFPDVPDPYLDDHLARIPDISAAGKPFYTWTFRRDLAPDLRRLAARGAAGPAEGSEARAWLHLRGISYFATVFVNGTAIAPTQAPSAPRLQGMFHRWSFDLGKAGAAARDQLAVAVRVEPPEFPGAPCRPCRDPPCTPCGQGGDHQIAKNAAMMQFTQGWDWIQATPDRNTGIWDVVSLALTQDVVITDPWVRTLSVTARGAGAGEDAAVVAAAAFVANRGRTAAAGTLHFQLLAPGGAVAATGEVAVELEAGQEREVPLRPLPVPNATLWWPHTHASGPFLYTARFAFTPATAGGGAAPTATAEVRAGLRAVEAVVDAQLGGWVFKVNGHRIYLEGGNWIHTDQLLRYATHRRRYLHEVRMHREMGLNVIRVWGGGLAERPEFYEACDEAGMLVLQEFWMSGDNNGRWAGSFDWPLDRSVFLACARDTARMLRPHPSLLAWCGGNELYPVVQQPVNHTHADPGHPANQMHLLAALKAELARADPGRFFIPSSMSNFSGYDPRFALAPKDGNYGINAPAAYFERNPGLYFPGNHSRMAALRIAFQPEIGSVSSPVRESLRRFMGPEALAAFPRSAANRSRAHPGRGGGGEPARAEAAAVHRVWAYHKYEGFTTAGGEDLLERYGRPTTLEQYSCQAQIAQLVQYQALFEGFRAHMWRWYSGVVLWKSQSPWPALRGALYDPYLAPTGGFWGVRAACGEAVHLQLNQATRTLAVVSRRFQAVQGLRARATWLRLDTGAPVEAPRLSSNITALPNAVTPVPGGALVWPIPPSAPDKDVVLLLRLQLESAQTGAIVSSNEYWLAPDKDGSVAAAAAWSAFRRWSRVSQGVTVEVVAELMRTGAAQPPRIALTLRHADAKKGCALMVRMQLVNSSAPAGEDSRVLPSWFSANYVSLVPGEERRVEVECCETGDDGAAARELLGAPAVPRRLAGLELRVDGFNVRPVSVPVEGTLGAHVAASQKFNMPIYVH